MATTSPRCWVVRCRSAAICTADMGHFGRKPIARAWFILVLPALVLNYFGQGAMLLGDPEAARNPFYLLAPSWALIPTGWAAMSAQWWRSTPWAGLSALRCAGLY